MNSRKVNSRLSAAVTNSLLTRLGNLHRLELKILDYVKSPLLLAVRLFWGWQFFLTGSGKLNHLERTTQFFASLGLPFPELNVILAGTTEAVGGLLLVLGLGSRLAPIALVFTMLVAYGTADRDAVTHIFSNADGFVTAAPFLFLYASILVLVFGPGSFSLDHLLGLWWKKRQALAATPPVESPKTALAGAA